MYSNLGILAGGPLYTQIDDRLESFLMVFSSLKQFSLKLNIVLQNSRQQLSSVCFSNTSN